MRLLKSLGRVGLSFFLTLAGAVLFVQLLLWAAPGDPIDLVPNGVEFRAELEAEWDLDRPLPARFAAYLGRAFQGDLGTSLTYRPGSSVSELAWPAALRSARTLVPALVLTLSVALIIAWFSGRRGGPAIRLTQAVSIAPVFLLAFLSVTFLNESTFSLIESGAIERPFWFALPDTDSWVRSLLAILVLAVGSGALSEVTAACTDELNHIRNAPFIEAAVARGARVAPHLIWNLIPAVASVFSNRAAFFVGGLVIIEKVLQLNGAGAMLWQACLMRDYPLAMGLTVMAAGAVCMARLISDVVRVAVDPRLREAA